MIFSFPFFPFFIFIKMRGKDNINSSYVQFLDKSTFEKKKITPGNAQTGKWQLDTMCHFQVWAPWVKKLFQMQITNSQTNHILIWALGLKEPNNY